MTAEVAQTPADVVRLAAASAALDVLDDRVSVCRACPRLVAWREEVARVKRASFANETYWGRPVPSWGSPDADVLVVGLAPAAHGGNRTGRIFTGDRSGDWLFAAMYRAGLAAQPHSTHLDDGQRLLGARIVAPVHCAPPANKPTPAERDACRPWLLRELELLRPTLRSAVALGSFAWQALWSSLAAAGFDGLPTRRPAFAHGVEVVTGGGLRAIGCYHVSQQNTFTGKLTVEMLDGVFARAVAHRGVGQTA